MQLFGSVSSLTTRRIRHFDLVEQREAFDCDALRRGHFLVFIDRQRSATQKPPLLVRETRQLIEDFS